jgi:hypothetical protein
MRCAFLMEMSFPRIVYLATVPMSFLSASQCPSPSVSTVIHGARKNTTAITA